MKVDMYVMGRYVGQREIGEDSLAAITLRALQGQADPGDVTRKLHDLKRDLEEHGATVTFNAKE